MEVFSECQKVNDFLLQNDEASARNELIKLLDYHEKENLSYAPVVNHLIRQVGLFPYLKPETSNWQDRFVYESFKTQNIFLPRISRDMAKKGKKIDLKKNMYIYCQIKTNNYEI